MHDCHTVPQRKFHLRLLRALVANDLADTLVLFQRQYPPLTRLRAPYHRLDGSHTTSLVPINRSANCRIRKTTELDDLHYAVTLAMQTNHLLALFVQLLQGRIPCAIFFHLAHLGMNTNISNIIVPDQ